VRRMMMRMGRGELKNSELRIVRSRIISLNLFLLNKKSAFIQICFRPSSVNPYSFCTSIIYFEKLGVLATATSEVKA
jgi:hypothetical protein